MYYKYVTRCLVYFFCLSAWRFGVEIPNSIAVEFNFEFNAKKYSIDLPCGFQIGNPEIIPMTPASQEISYFNGFRDDSQSSQSYLDWPTRYLYREHHRCDYQFSLEALEWISCSAYDPERQELYRLSYQIFRESSGHPELYYIKYAENQVIKKCNMATEKNGCFLIGCVPTYSLSEEAFNQSIGEPGSNQDDLFIALVRGHKSASEPSSERDFRYLNEHCETSILPWLLNVKKAKDMGVPSDCGSLTVGGNKSQVGMEASCCLVQ